MKAKIIFVLFLIAALLGTFGFLGSRALLKREEISKINSNLVFLQKAIKQYAADAKQSGKADIYPDSLRSLVEENYLTNTDLADVMEGAEVEYIKPTNASAPSTIIIKARFGKTTLLCPIDGPIQQQKVLFGNH